MQATISADPFLAKIKADLEGDRPAATQYELIHGVLFYKGRIVIPAQSSWIPKLLAEFHLTPSGDSSRSLVHVEQVLIKWEGLGEDEATWMDVVDVRGQFPYFRLGDKVVLSDGAVDKEGMWKVAQGFGYAKLENPSSCVWLNDLRFLAFSYSTVNPASVSSLQNLQTLIIYSNNSSVVVHLPVEIWKMPWLRHLISPSLQLLLHPDGATTPSERLQTLSLATNFECNEGMVKMIPNVRKLGVCYSQEKLSSRKPSTFEST
ncbi:hypothetical protein SASPL_150640 [Salvia splendens]|uniref:Uncharacterized protein n=1 Tax=Salvia splendens TaxID=180675 RepID=A0A8X8W745_SALSN|nr:hypothetical protein SASPL_150640 [Salvia splendens]